MFEMVTPQDGLIHSPEVELVNGAYIKRYTCPPQATFVGFWGYGVKLRQLGVIFRMPTEPTSPSPRVLPSIGYHRKVS